MPIQRVTPHSKHTGSEKRPSIVRVNAGSKPRVKSPGIGPWGLVLGWKGGWAVVGMLGLGIYAIFRRNLQSMPKKGADAQIS